jgi:hypothetical protein
MKAKLLKIKSLVKSHLLLSILIVSAVVLLATVSVYASYKGSQETTPERHTPSTTSTDRTNEDKLETPEQDTSTATVPTENPNAVAPKNSQSSSAKTNQAEVDATKARLEKMAKEQAQNTLCLNLNREHWPNYQYTRDVTIQNEYTDTMAKILSDYNNGSISLEHRGNLETQAVTNKRAKVANALGSYNQTMKNAGCNDFVQ